MTTDALGEILKDCVLQEFADRLDDDIEDEARAFIRRLLHMEGEEFVHELAKYGYSMKSVEDDGNQRRYVLRKDTV